LCEFAELIEAGEDPAASGAIRAAELTGRPLGTADFVADLERLLGRPIARRAPGRKPVIAPAGQPRLL
jgi:putative transposase